MGACQEALAGGSGARLLLRQAVSLWLIAETLFWVYMESARRYLSSQTNRRWQAVTTHSTEEKKRKSMERYLLALVQICKRDGVSDEFGSPRRRHSSCGLRGAPTPSPGQLTLGNHRLRHEDSGSLGRILSRSNLLGLGQPNAHREQSVDDMLKLWEGNDRITDDELRLVKWTELASFFRGPGRGEAQEITAWLQRGNVEDFVSHYWFRGATPQELEHRSPKEKAELVSLVDLVLDNMGLKGLPQGRSADIRPYLLFSDPLPVLHRPLAVYAVSSLLVPVVTMKVMSTLGFHKERIGGLTYWHKPRRCSVDAVVDIAGPMQTPMVVVHGLGLGLVPYYIFIGRLAKSYGGDLFVPELPFLATQPWLSVPSAREIVAQLTDMLKAHGHSAAHFAGHSFGAIVVGWVMKKSPSSVVYVTLLEPACFLMMKAETYVKVLYGEMRNTFEIFSRYYCFRELFTVNLLCRNLFWEQSTMWPEDLHVPAVIELASDDSIVHGLFVRRLLEHERTARRQRRMTRRSVHGATSHSSKAATEVLLAAGGSEAAELIDILWMEGFQHGEILFRPDSQDKLFSKMRSMVQDAYAEASGSGCSSDVMLAYRRPVAPAAVA